MMNKMDKWDGTLLLDAIKDEVKMLEADVVRYLDEAHDPTMLHEECPLLFVILEDFEQLAKRVKRARKQMAEANV